MVAGLVLLVAVGLKTSVKENHASPFVDLGFRGATHDALADILKDPRVRAARSCGPISTPSHKLIPDVRWLADLPEDQVLARSDPEHSPRDLGAVDADGKPVHTDHATAKGLALLVTTRQTLLRQAVVEDNDTALDNIPLPGFRRLAYNGTYAIYTSC
jgi:hypothetical protein